MMKRLLITALLAPLALGCSSDSKGGNGGSDGPVWQGTYLLDIPGTNWVEPQGIGDDVALFVHQFILKVDGTSSTDYTVTVGPAADGVQDTCSKTVELSATASAPDSAVGPGDYELYLPAADAAMNNGTGDWADYKVIANIKNFTLTNVLPDGDTPRSDGELSAQADARDLWPLFYQILGASPDTVCGTIAQAGETTCEDCADGEPYCLTMVAKGLGATAFSGDFQTVSESCPDNRPPEQ